MMPVHVGIVGAGLGGLVAAIGITRAGHRATILEQASELGEIGAGIQIPPNSTRILHRYGLIDKIESVAVRPHAFILRSYRDGTILNSAPMIPDAVQKYGYPYLHIHRADYHRILVDEARRLGVDIWLGCAVTRLDFADGRVHIRDKPSFQADLIIGADGLKSVCREALLSRPDPPRLTGDLAYRIVIPCERMLPYPELRELVDKPAIHYWMGPHAHVVCYLLQGGSLCNIVLLCPDNLPELVNTAKADLQEMRDFFRDWDPKLKTLLGLVQETSKWRLQNSEEMARWSHDSGKFVLLGDACHATLPYLAQGAAQAVEDGAVLGSLLSHLETPSQIPDLLTIYERIRKERTTRIVKGSTALRDVFHMQDGDRQRERDRQLLHEEPFDGYPNRWGDPVFQQWLFEYDAEKEVEAAWERYKAGVFPGTRGYHRSRL